MVRSSTRRVWSLTGRRACARPCCRKDGVLGSRPSGAGFRGFCIALARKDRAAAVADAVLAQVRRRARDLAARRGGTRDHSRFRCLY